MTTTERATAGAAAQGLGEPAIAQPLNYHLHRPIVVERISFYHTSEGESVISYLTIHSWGMGWLLLERHEAEALCHWINMLPAVIRGRLHVFTNGWSIDRLSRIPGRKAA